MIAELQRVRDLLVEGIEVDAREHTAVEDLHARHDVPVLVVHEDEALLRDETPRLEVCACDRGADIIRVDVEEALLHKLLPKPHQLFLEGIRVHRIEIVAARAPIGIAAINVLERHSAVRRRLSVLLDRRDRALHGGMPRLQLPHLLMQLFVFLHQQRLDQRDILLLEDVLDLGQTHPELLHIRDHIEPRVLRDVVVAVACLRVRPPRLQQIHLIVEPKRRHRDAIHLCHPTDAHQIIHASPPASANVSDVTSSRRLRFRPPAVS